MRLCPLSDQQIRRLIERGRIIIVGYPSDRPVGTMWRDTERLVRAGARRLLHTVDTCPGHSGSPILSRINGDPVIIGVHTAGILDTEGRSHGCKRGTVLAPPGSVNSGVRLVADMIGGEVVVAVGKESRGGDDAFTLCIHEPECSQVVERDRLESCVNDGSLDCIAEQEEPCDRRERVVTGEAAAVNRDLSRSG